MNSWGWLNLQILLHVFDSQVVRLLDSQVEILGNACRMLVCYNSSRTRKPTSVVGYDKSIWQTPHGSWHLTESHLHANWTVIFFCSIRIHPICLMSTLKSQGHLQARLEVVCHIHIRCLDTLQHPHSFSNNLTPSRCGLGDWIGTTNKKKVAISRYLSGYHCTLLDVWNHCLYLRIYPII